MKKILFILLSFAIFATSCMEDTGNYDYRDIEDFEITGVESGYSVLILENLNIPASISAAAGDFSAVWFIEQKDISAGFDDNTVADTISRELVLDIPFKYKPGTYNLYLKVTNNNTGVAKYAKTEILASTQFSTGYYLLKETSDGNTEMDLHYPDGDKVENIISFVTGAPLSGKPKTLSYLNDYSYLNEATGEKDVNYLLLPLSENGMYTFNMTDMSIAREYGQWFYSADDTYDVKKIHHINSVGFSFAMFTESGVFTNYQCAKYQMYSVGKFSPLPDLMYDGTNNYSSSNNVCYFEFDNYTYDAVNNQLISVDYNGGVSSVSFQYPPLLADQDPTPESFEDKIIYIGGVQGYATDNLVIVCEKADGSRYFYYAMAESESYEMNIANKADFEASSAFADAKIYATCRKDGNYLYAASGNDVYAINPENGASTKLVIPSMPAGEITYMDTMWYETSGDDSYNYFVIATENSGNYTVAFYEMIGGEPVKGKEPVRILQGKGKIKTVQHADPGKNGNVWSMTRYSVHY